MVSKRRDRSRRPARRPRTRNLRRRILVVCEGTVTEPTYLKSFKNWCRNPLVAVEIPKQQGAPRTIVDVAKERRAEAAAHAKSEGDDNLSFDEVWCVFDVDEHPSVNDACEMARNNDIHVAVSNPCFELWVILHFRESPGAQDRHTIQKMLRTFIPDYDKHLDFDVLSPNYSTAVTRAARLQQQADDDREPRRNPTTGVHRLTASIARESGTP